MTGTAVATLPAQRQRVAGIADQDPETFLTCQRCGFDFLWPTLLAPPDLCPDCHSARGPLEGNRPRVDVTSPAYRLASVVTDYRVAIELAYWGMRIGRYDDALTALAAARHPRPSEAQARIVDLKRRQARHPALPIAEGHVMITRQAWCAILSEVTGQRVR